MLPPPITYEFRIEGQLDQRWLDWFDGLQLVHTDNAETILTGTMRDQAALYGTLMKMRDLGLTLVSVTRIEPDSQTDASSQ